MSILAILNELAATASRLEKEAILKREINNELLKSVVKAAYDPTINYFIKKMPSPTSMGGKFDLATAIVMLDDIRNRVFTGNAASDLLGRILGTCESQDDAEVIRRIVDRNLQCGINTTVPNKIWKGLIPEFPYMRCSLPKEVKLETWAWKSGILSQIKADGMFANLDVVDGEVSISSRSGTQFDSSKFGLIVDEALDNLPDGVRLNGEFLVMIDGKIAPREIGNGILNSVAKGGSFSEGQEPIYIVWDILPLHRVIPRGSIDIPYGERYAELREIFVEDEGFIRIIETKTVYSMEEAYEHYFHLIDLGYEGTIVKNPNGIWEDKTSKNQVKLKVVFDCDLEIIGFREGDQNGKHAKTFGSIICRSSDGQLEVAVSGMSDAQRLTIHNDRDNMIGKIIAVESNNIMPPVPGKPYHSLFLPQFLEIREDKSEADSLERIKEQFYSVIKK